MGSDALAKFVYIENQCRLVDYKGNDKGSAVNTRGSYTFHDDQTEINWSVSPDCVLKTSDSSIDLKTLSPGIVYDLKLDENRALHTVSSNTTYQGLPASPIVVTILSLIFILIIVAAVVAAMYVNKIGPFENQATTV